MGKKKNSLNLRQPTGVEDNILHRPAPPVAALYLMKLRAQMHKNSLPQRSIRLPIYMDSDQERPQSVKIRVRLNSAAAETLPAVERVSLQADTDMTTRDGG